jgi:hypothetical protein
MHAVTTQTVVTMRLVQMTLLVISPAHAKADLLVSPLYAKMLMNVNLKITVALIKHA